MKTLHSNAKIDEKVTAKVICDEWSSCEVKTLEVKVKVKVKGRRVSCDRHVRGTARLVGLICTDQV